MIRLEGRAYTAYCDGECGASVNTGLRSFQQAVNYMTREVGWINRKDGDRGWRNYCAACGDMPDPERENAGLYFGRRIIADDD